MTIGEMIKIARKRQNLTQAELAERLGVNQSSISSFESSSYLRESTIRKIADALNVEITELLPVADLEEYLNKEMATAFANDLTFDIEILPTISYFVELFKGLNKKGIEELTHYAEYLSTSRGGEFKKEE